MFLLYSVRLRCVYVRPGHLHPGRNWTRKDLSGTVSWSSPAGPALVCPLSHATFSLWKFMHFLCPGYSSYYCIYHPGDTVVQTHTWHTHFPCTHVSAHLSCTHTHTHTHTLHVYELPHTHSSLGKLSPSFLLLLLHSVLPPPPTSKHRPKRWAGRRRLPPPVSLGGTSPSLTIVCSQRLPVSSSLSPQFCPSSLCATFCISLPPP